MIEFCKCSLENTKYCYTLYEQKDWIDDVLSSTIRARLVNHYVSSL